jgi:Spondin_N
MRASIRTSLTILGIAALGAAPSQADESNARYRVDFERTWSSDTHPEDFPLLAHFSPVIGVTHGDRFELFAKGGTATPGLEKLCEEGKHQPLDEEIQRAIANGSVGALIETSDPLRSAPQTATSEFEIDSSHPMVSIAAMIAPSPDWCAVANDVSLMDGGHFVDSRTVQLQAWDIGTDSATSYRALDADMQPRGPIQPSDSKYFQNEGAPRYVGSVTFTRIR